MVATETITNISRPPNLSVSAPTRIRPTEPTITGTATISATCDSLRTPRAPLSRNTGPSGLSSAQAQKLIANPIVARASISHGVRAVTLRWRSDVIAVLIGATGLARFACRKVVCGRLVAHVRSPSLDPAAVALPDRLSPARTAREREGQTSHR